MKLNKFMKLRLFRLIILVLATLTTQAQAFFLVNYHEQNDGTCPVLVKYHFTSTPAVATQLLNPGQKHTTWWVLVSGIGIWYTWGPTNTDANLYSSFVRYFDTTADIYGNFGLCEQADDESDDGDAQPPRNSQENWGGDDCGMPVWSVSEPYLSLWLHDEPLGYQPAIGPRVSFELSYKQRETTAGYNKNSFSIGNRWNCNWLSYIAPNANGGNTVYFPGGRQRTFTGAEDLTTDTRLSGDWTNGFAITYRDGSKNVYSLIVTNNSGAFMQALLTERWNATAQSMRFLYDPIVPSLQPVVRLRYVIDGDGRTNTLYYVTNHPYSTNLVSHVVDPFNRTNHLLRLA